MIREGAYPGAFAVTGDMPEGAGFVALVDYLNTHMNKRSIVANSIGCAIQGDFGDCQTTGRTLGNELFVNPRMAFYRAFRLPGMVRSMRYADMLCDTQTLDDVARELHHFRILYPQRRLRKTVPL